VLVNNVGCAKAGTLDAHTPEDITRMVNVNVKAQTFLTHAMIPRFLKRNSRSAIIDISSVRHFVPGGNVPVYSASKSYNYSFSKAMAQAYSEKVDVMTVTPGSIKTNMNSGRYFFCISAQEHAKCVIDQLGWYTETMGHWMHAI